VFFIMELMEGSTLREELNRSHRLPTSRVLHIMRGVCSAVDAAHQHNLIHRDLKPENIFLCQRSSQSPGESEAAGTDIPKVMDFGVAKALDRGQMLTEPGHVAGTPQYMSPEHARGGEPSPDWDLWALAVMTFEMITGRLPRQGDGSTALPGSAHRFFSRALASDPTDRPTSANELFAELEHALGSTE
jgi:serine/threonine-protein kinase